MSEETRRWQRVPRSMTTEMRELLLRADEFTVNEMWIMLLAAAPEPSASVGMEPLTDTYVQVVPNKCDRIVWRNSCYHLPLETFAEQLATLQAKRAQAEKDNAELVEVLKNCVPCFAAGWYVSILDKVKNTIAKYEVNKS